MTPLRSSVPARLLIRLALLIGLLTQNAALAQDVANRIEAVVLQQGYGSGYGGTITVVYRPAVLFKDGAFTKDADKALSDQARIDGRWRRDGSGWLLTGNDGKTTKVEAGRRALPAERGRTLQGEYANASGVGAPGTGVAVVSAWRSMQFARDGSVRLSQGAGASGAGTATASRQSGNARYRLDGYGIVFDLPDGRSERRLFYFFPDSEHVIGVGASTLTLRR